MVVGAKVVAMEVALVAERAVVREAVQEAVKVVAMGVV